MIVSELSDYSQRLSYARALTASLLFVILFASILMSLFFTFRATKPIRSLITMLQSPKTSPVELVDVYKRQLHILLQKAQKPASSFP